MLKKIVTYLLFILFLISCDAVTARNQFERGEYRESVKTTLRITENGKYSNLKQEEKLELINRIKTIDNYYMNKINSGDIKEVYDAFAIGYMVNTKMSNLSPYLNYLTSRKTSELSYRLENIVDRRLSYSYNENDLSEIYDIRQDMKEIGILNSNYQSVYRKISKKLADTYYKLANNASNEENELKYLKLAYSSFSDFDSDYRQTKTRYRQLEKKIDIRNAKSLTDEAKSDYYFGNYDNALEKFEKAYDLFDKYSDYSFEKRDVKEYIDNIKVKVKEQKAQKYFEEGLYYRSIGDYRNAAIAFYNAHNIIPNYRGSYNLAKECEQKSKYQKKTYRLYTNSTRANFVEKELYRYGFDKNSYNPYFTLDYTEDVRYTSNYNSETIRVVCRIYSRELNFSASRTIEKTNFSYRQLGKEEMLRIYNGEINNEVSEMIRSLSRR